VWRSGTLRRGLETAVDLLYPPHCAVCETSIETGEWLCSPCTINVQRINKPRCENCSHPFHGLAGNHFVCPNCEGQPFHFEFAVAVMKAGGTTRELIHRFKYAKEQRLAVLLGDWLADAFTDSRFNSFPVDLVVPVPLHAARQREREYNQSELLARHVAKIRKIPFSDVLRRSRFTNTQTQFDRRERMRNLRDAFKLRNNASVDQLRIVLVDDVLTTGSTLDECARVLIDAGAARVCAIAVARG
jgi:ComF family protein